jgi:hypothetical protein
LKILFLNLCSCAEYQIQCSSKACFNKNILIIFALIQTTFEYLSIGNIWLPMYTLKYNLSFIDSNILDFTQTLRFAILFLDHLFQYFQGIPFMRHWDTSRSKIHDYCEYHNHHSIKYWYDSLSSSIKLVASSVSMDLSLLPI